MKRISVWSLIIALVIPLLVGGLSATISAKGMANYGTMDKPPLSPPAWLFSVAWTLLYVMMGLASYFIYDSEAYSFDKSTAMKLYVIQLAMNFLWAIVFFNWGLYFIAFIWLLVLWCVSILCAAYFFKINRTAGWLFVPYIAWLTFAAYLNLGTVILNMGKEKLP